MTNLASVRAVGARARQLHLFPKLIALCAPRLAIMVGSMGTSTTDLRPVEGGERIVFSAPALPVMWTADDELTDHGVVRMAHRVLVVDGTFPMTANVVVDEPVAVADLEAFGFALVRSFRDTHGTSVFMQADGAALSAFVGGNSGRMHVSTPDVASLDALVARLRARFPGKAESTAMQIRSWSNGRFGPDATVVRHDFPGWDASRQNFPGATRDVVAQLVGLERPVGGSVMVWHGPPGTGKTTAIRALAREWQAWCDLELIIDPESFFSNASYLMGVLTSGPLADDDEDCGSEDAASGAAPADAPKRWKLIVVEDCDDLLLRAARAGSNGQLSRLLNVCDGLLGQELNVIVLFTTNAPLHAIHPAVLRPGRCLATVEFGPFTAAEVAARGSGVEAREVTLAELMAAEGGLPKVVGAEVVEERVNGYL